MEIILIINLSIAHNIHRIPSNQHIDKMPQCQFLFSALFGFRNPTQEIFSELDGTKSRDHNFVVTTKKTKRESKTGTRSATP